MSNNNSNEKTIRPRVLRGAAARQAANAFNDGNIASFDPRLSRKQHAVDSIAIARAEAIDAGYRDGLEAAMADVEAATAEANKQARRALAALCEAVDSFDQRQTLALAHIEDEVVLAAFALARSILQRELQLAADPGAEAIARAMKLAPNRGDVIARLHPGDVATLRLERVATTTRAVEIVPDPTVEPGGCIVEIDDTHIDSQISSVLAKVGEALGLTPEQVSETAHVGQKNSLAGED